MIGDSRFDTLNWHGRLLKENVVPVAPYNHRNTDGSLDIEYRVQDRVMDHFDVIGVSQIRLEETHADRSQFKNTINVCKEGGQKAHVLLSLCLRPVVEITNYE